MGNTRSNQKQLAVGLGVLQMFIGIGAIPAGIWMILDPSGHELGLSLDMLANAPFTDFLIPGVFLLVINGIGSVLGGIASFKRHRFAGEIAIGLGAFLMAWIAIQVWWMGVHWLHVLYFILGFVELMLGFTFRRYRETAG